MAPTPPSYLGQRHEKLDENRHLKAFQKQGKESMLTALRSVWLSLLGWTPRKSSHAVMSPCSELKSKIQTPHSGHRSNSHQLLTQPTPASLGLLLLLPSAHQLGLYSKLPP
ncbi:unnamed protein product [Rangifer tarandus platyrhynchus]|uniref:Uncharacterized protein n=1 Tax=Rangifer tarandus platyrhynchus TaxID=3082113 RepID=A0AC60A8H4_RANTA